MKTVIVTGVTLGVGNSLVTKFSNLGYKVIATSRDPESLTNKKSKLGWSDNVFIENLHLSEKNTIAALHEKYKNEKIDLIVNNAAGGSQGSKSDLFEAFTYSTSLNIGGPAYLNKLFVNNLKQSDNPTIIFISSIAGKYPYPGDMTYCLSKNGVSKLSEIFRVELHNTNIKITEIRPASINTRENNPNMFHLNVDDIVNTIEWVFNMPNHCSIDLIEMSEIRTRRFM